MKVAPPRDDLRFDFAYALIHYRGKILRAGGRGEDY